MFPVNIVHWQVGIKNETYITFYTMFQEIGTALQYLTTKHQLPVSFHNLPVKLQQPYSIIDGQFK